MADIEIPDEARAAFVPLLNAIADQQHEHLCNCGAYPDGCVSEASYTRESLVAGLYNAESGLEEAWRQGWRPTTDLPGPASMVRDLLQAVYPGDPMPDRPLDTIWDHLIEQVTQQTARMDVRVAERDDALTMVFEQGTRYRAEIAALRAEAAAATRTATYRGEVIAHLDAEVETLRQALRREETDSALLTDRLAELVMEVGGPVPEDRAEALSILQNALQCGLWLIAEARHKGSVFRAEADRFYAVMQAIHIQLDRLDESGQDFDTDTIRATLLANGVENERRAASLRGEA
ncbi:MAG TPA: hypothetical protein VGL02_32170 [Streptomyces sp.]